MQTTSRQPSPWRNGEISTDDLGVAAPGESGPQARPRDLSATPDHGPEGLRRRKSKAIPLAEFFARLRPDECDDKLMLQRGKADETCLTTATELKRREWGTEGFGSTLLRHALFAIYQTADRDDTKISLNRLKTEIAAYWAQRENLVEMLRYVGKLPIAH